MWKRVRRSRTNMLIESTLLVRKVLAFLSFVIPTLIIGFAWKFWLFAEGYAALGMYREDIFFPFALGSLLVQGIFWSYLYAKLFAGESWARGALKLFALSFPLGISFNVFVIGAKHVMSSISNFALLETGFTVVMYTVVSILIAAAYSVGKQR